MENPVTKIESASVKVMRSHDYCHFEVSLTSYVLGETNEEQLKAVDELRKEAARIADKAVVQYRISKANAERLLAEKETRRYLIDRIQEIRQVPEGERTVNDQAELKAYDDETWKASRPYNYEDDWEHDP